jgi:hypothetical protein
VEYSQEAITKRLAHTIWETFEKAGITNDAEGNYRVADSIIKRIIDRTYAAEEWAHFLSVEDMRTLFAIREERDRGE